jgi:HEAT repeat protein
LQLKPEADNSLDDPLDRPTDPPTADKATPGQTANVATATNPAEQRTPSRPERPSGDNQPRFDLAAWVATPEFREIHTPPVLEGLELLARPEPRHRALGAMRIAAAGRDARTALPVLRRLLASETNQTVRLRIAEAVLKVQPNDRAATEYLSELLSDRTDWELRENAASAFGSAASGRNSIAIARLTDALDDANPHVRTAAASSLALFGPAAADSVSRLEGAAGNDVPSVQRAASLALASIRGGESELSADRSTAVGRDNPFALKPTASPLSNPMAGPIPYGRVNLSDRPAVEDFGESEIRESDVARATPKLFPADRIGSARSLTPIPELADDDAVPANATDVNATDFDAPPKLLTPAPAAAIRALPVAPVQPQPQPQSQPQAQPIVVQPFVSPAATSTFLLQSEAGASKASSNP